MEQHSSSLINDISDSINSSLDNGKSLRQIAHHTDVDYSYIRRLVQKKISYSQIDPVKLFLILKFVENIEVAYKIIDHNEDWVKKVKNWTGFNKSIALNAIENRDIEKIILQDDLTIIAFILASNQGGTSPSQLIEVGGHLLIKASELLKSERILIENDGVITPTNIKNKDGEFFTFTRTAYKRIIPALTKYYDVTHAGQKRNYIYGSTGGYSREFVHEFHSKVEELRSWYTINSRKDHSKGNNPLFFAMLMDTFTDQLSTEEEVLQ